MIIDGPITFDMTVGSDRRIPEGDDAQTRVPPVIMPVVLAVKPTTLTGGGVVAAWKTSFYVDVGINRLNQAAVTQFLALLAPGLWEIEMTLASQFDYAGAVGTFNGANIQLVDTLGNTVRMLSRYAMVGTFSDYNRVRILTALNCTLNLDLSITGVGQHLDARAAVNCIRTI